MEQTECPTCLTIEVQCVDECRRRVIFSTAELLNRLSCVGESYKTGDHLVEDLLKVDESQWLDWVDSRLEVMHYFRRDPVFGPLKIIADLNREKEDLTRQLTEFKRTRKKSTSRAAAAAVHLLLQQHPLLLLLLLLHPCLRFSLYTVTILP